MNDEFLKLLSILNEKKAVNFFDNTKSSVNVIEDVTKITRDLSWIDLLEETIPYIDSIVRNPRRYIVSEEDLIPVEKTKKITEESVRHLAKHTSLIQDVDKDGFVKPLKLLNVFKEETFDVYENRFIYSLIINSKEFLQDQLALKEINLKGSSLKTVNYVGKTSLDNENISVSLEIVREKVDDNYEDGNLEARIRRAIEIFDDFISTDFIRNLKHATPVHSPIRKTNVILKDKNFNMCVLLWEMIEKFDVKNVIKEERIRKLDTVSGLSKKLCVSSYLQYYDSCDKSEINIEENGLLIRKLIEALIENGKFSEKEFKNMLTKEYKKYKDKKDNVYVEIRHILRNNLKIHENMLKKSLLYLK